MSLPPAVADARATIAHAERYRRIWRRVRVAMVAVLSVFLLLVLVYTVLALSAGMGVWYWSLLLVAAGFFIFLLVLVLRHRGTERMFDAEVEAATRRLNAAGYRPVLRDGRVLVAPAGAPDEAAVEV